MAPQGQRSRTTSATETTGAYIAALDGLRALGIGLVFVHHMITPLSFGGAVGVDIFFVLSGYLITSILLRQRSRRGSIDLKAFYLRRAIRLYPALLTVITVLAVPGLLFAPSIKAYVLENILAATYTTPIALEVNGTAAWAWRHTWSLGIEELFYLVWPLVLLALLGTRHPRLTRATIVALLGLGLLVGGIAVETTGHHSLLLRSGGIFLGCALALRMSEQDGGHQQKAVPSYVAFLGTSMIIVAVALASIEGVLAVPVLLTASGTTLVVAHVISSPAGAVSTVLSWGPLRYLGRISYELYLWHYPCLIILGWAFDADPLAVAVVAAPASVLASALTHRILNPKISRWKDGVSH